MAISAKVDLTVTPPVLTVTSDRRKVSVLVTAVGESTTATGLFPVTVTDSSGKQWKPVSDDGTTAVYN